MNPAAQEEFKEIKLAINHAGVINKSNKVETQAVLLFDTVTLLRQNGYRATSYNKGETIITEIEK